MKWKLGLLVRISDNLSKNVTTQLFPYVLVSSCILSIAETLMAEALSLRYEQINGSSFDLKKSGFFIFKAKLIKALFVYNLTLHLGSYKHLVRFASIEAIISGPKTSINLVAA